MMDYSFLQRQQTISSVCSSWWSLVEDSPRFWSIIEFSCPLAAISHSLEKSQSSDLEIKSFTDTEYDCAPMEFFGEETCLRLIAPHADRIRSLILSLSSEDGLLTVLGNPAPILEELKIDGPHCDFAQPLDLFCGQASRLSDVVLGHIPIGWDSDVLVGLRSLTIKEELGHLPTEGQVQRLLETNPWLEKLDIENVTDTEHFRGGAVQSTGEGKPSRLVMSKMQELRLWNLPFKLAQTVLDNVEIPAIRYFNLKCQFRGLSASRLLGPNIEHLLPPLLQRSQGAQRAELTLGEFNVSLAIYTPSCRGPTIEIELEETVPFSGSDWLAESFFLEKGLPSLCAADIFQVSLKFKDGFYMAGGAFIPILDRLNAVKVKDLVIESECERGEELIKYLGEAKEDSQWPLPYLTSMKIGGPAALADHLLIALQRRKQHMPVGEMPGAPRPVMLEVLDIGDLREVDGNVENALANCVASSGTFIPGWRRWRRASGPTNTESDIWYNGEGEDI
ncbi:hypothetical protein FRC00_000412 [Tulasnella sp. 408]|nr:hypothetical protein FRC00_000412 [Tulasnella sp. 408]